MYACSFVPKLSSRMNGAWWESTLISISVEGETKITKQAHPAMHGGFGAPASQYPEPISCQWNPPIPLFGLMFVCSLAETFLLNLSGFGDLTPNCP